MALGPNKKKSSFARQYSNLSDTCLNTETTQTPQKDAALYKQKGMGQSPPSHKTDCLSHYSLCVSAKMLWMWGEAVPFGQVLFVRIFNYIFIKKTV